MAALLKIEAILADLTREVAQLKLQHADTKDATPPRGPRLIHYDLETTGLGKTKDIRICEIGLLDHHTGDSFQRYVNPGKPISKSATSVHSLKREFLETHPGWDETGHEVAQYLDRPYDIILGGFNSKRYDSRIFTFEMMRHGCPLPTSLYTVDFRVVFKTLFPDAPKTSLGGYYAHVTGKENIPDAHTALGDARALKVLCEAANQKELWDEIEKHKESWESVRKRCLR